MVTLSPNGDDIMDQENRHEGLDFFKLWAACLVVAIHTSPLASFSSTADFILTRILARVAVPFFLMVTGYFILPQYLFFSSTNLRPLKNWLIKMFKLYIFATILYLPVNIYVGQTKEIEIYNIFKDLFFDGTFYHLWYLPAAMIGILLIYLMSRRFLFKEIVIISLILYIIGLFGDSYNGFIAESPMIYWVYDTMFSIFSYTRNGIFYAPIFLVMGAMFAKSKISKSSVNIIVLIFLLILMCVEGMVLHDLRVQRHDSMYITLIPCMFFLYKIILLIKVKPVKNLHIFATGIYLIHPLVIIIIHFVAKAIYLEEVIINNSLIHYGFVVGISFILSLLFVGIISKKHKDTFHYGRAWIELNRENLYHNIAILQNLLPSDCKLMPAIKANAYGHGSILVAKELNLCGINAFCVASVLEAEELRKGGIKGDILILGYTAPQQFGLLKKYNLIQSVIDYPYAVLLNQYGKKIRVHLKIDTGMHRLGVRVENMEEIFRIFDLKNLTIEGVYTHLCNADAVSPVDKEFTFSQGKEFFKVITQLEKCKGVYPKIHIQSSYGVLNYPELSGNYARIGISMYGVLSDRKDLQYISVELYPVLSVKARVALVKELLMGETAGYGCHYIAEQDRKIAVLTIGYADGIPRDYADNAGYVLINGIKAPIIGRICMDQTLIDVTDIPNVNQGDIAVIIGKSGEHELTAYDVAERTGTITNEVLSRLGKRLDRVVV